MMSLTNFLMIRIDSSDGIPKNGASVVKEPWDDIPEEELWGGELPQ